MMTELTLPIIGYMHSSYKEKFGIPRQPNLVQVESYIEMLAPYNDVLAFEGIEAFSHLWLVWQFHDNKNPEKTQFRPQVRPPRLGGNKKIGVFATRSMYRPSPIGLSVVKLKYVKKEGKSVRVYVTGSDLLDGTPIVDIKPYIHYSDAVIKAESGYAQDEPNRKSVIWSDRAIEQKQQLLTSGKLSLLTVQELEAVLSLDPRPAYQDDEARIYGMKFANLDVKFKVNETCIEIQEL
ncbi:MAG: tRNA (N6-threonylcarbamoyladenosine(37)-N6)-methyltransferase TrmO [Acinetobacter johnsonii]|uniref:tRNA (N6-threonylcarbamoyladenosine(37)-N6)-methyltransferase TrmO n=1 Tax=Acinetobacter johnsonii TaxID=40214 RepID=A0A2W5R9H8_ACIJO|nr:MAG: tRNA (N6-threonylcarbamoyladenosine(37)-N6)-methyltransferase TrmO [Acinetobacter johnsonii]